MLKCYGSRPQIQLISFRYDSKNPNSNKKKQNSNPKTPNSNKKTKFKSKFLSQLLINFALRSLESEHKNQLLKNERSREVWNANAEMTQHGDYLRRIQKKQAPACKNQRELWC